MNSNRLREGINPSINPCYPVEVTANPFTFSDDSGHHLQADDIFEDIEYLDSSASEEHSPELEYYDLEYLDDADVAQPVQGTSTCHPDECHSTTIVLSIEPTDPEFMDVYKSCSIDSVPEPPITLIENNGSDLVEPDSGERSPLPASDTPSMQRNLSSETFVPHWSNDDTNSEPIPDYKTLFYEEKKTSVQLREELKKNEK